MPKDGARRRAQRKRNHELPDDLQFIEELGRGGMSVVYLARERLLGREVAVKVIRDELVSDRVAQAQFEREARTIARLQHPNIVAIHAIRRLEGHRLALVMQHIDGITLKEAIAKVGAFPVERTVRVLREISGALAYAHARGVVHRDIKPSNIVLEEGTGRAMLTDFGVAIAEDMADGGLAAGTPAYMAPEQIDGAELDGRADLYSLALVGWEMLTGQQPWANHMLSDVLDHQRHSTLPSLTEFRSDVPWGLQRVVEQGLAKAPDERWQSAEEFFYALNSSGEPKKWRLSRTLKPGGAIKRVQPQWTEIPTETLLFRRDEAVPSMLSAPEAPKEPAVSRPVEEPAVPEAEELLVPLIEEAPLVVPPPSPRRVLSRSRIAMAASAAGIVLLAGVAAMWAREPQAERIHASAPIVASASARTFESAGEVGSKFTTISRSSGHQCAVDQSGWAWCWGSNTAGQLGDGTHTDRERPVPVATVLRFVSVAAGRAHTCAATASRAVYCWGSDDRGQLAQSDRVPRLIPVRVADVRADTIAGALIAGDDHTCALSRGTVWCWGVARGGDLERATMPTRLNVRDRVSSLASTEDRICATTVKKRVLCWERSGGFPAVLRRRS